MSSYGGINNFSHAGRRPMMIAAQLYTGASSMHHIDEMFQWLANVIVVNFDVQAAQFWALQANRMGQVSAQLRCMVYQEKLFPGHIIANNQVATTASQILQGQSNYSLQRVESLFPSYQASLLERYGLLYCAYYVLIDDRLLPPAYDAPATEIPTPLTVAVLLFLRQPVPQNELSAINLILEQSVAVAASRELLLPASTGSGRLPSLTNNSLQQQPQLSLGGLIPQRVEDTDLLKSSNPLAGSLVISDKQARRLFTAIDGRKNVEEICMQIDMDLKEAYKALQVLLAQHRVQLYGPEGQLVESSVFLEDLR